MFQQPFYSPPSPKDPKPLSLAILSCPEKDSQWLRKRDNQQDPQGIGNNACDRSANTWATSDKGQ